MRHNIKGDIKAIQCKTVDWIYSITTGGLVNTTMNLQVLLKKRCFLQAG
jgi:hypothetical protein